MFNILLIRGGIKGGFPLSIIGKRGEGYQHNQHKPQEQGKEKGREREGKRRRGRGQRAEGQKLKKLQKKIFFCKSQKKKYDFSIRGCSAYSI
tara:strand:+ start:33 stop:308 length:276 start_codon:yes stop_codon:yes gene_type:complete